MLKLIKLNGVPVRLAELAKEVGISYQTLRKEAREGKLEVFKIGEKIIYTTYQNFENYLNRSFDMPLVKSCENIELKTIIKNAVLAAKQRTA